MTRNCETCNAFEACEIRQGAWKWVDHETWYCSERQAVWGDKADYIEYCSEDQKDCDFQIEIIPTEEDGTVTGGRFEAVCLECGRHESPWAMNDMVAKLRSELESATNDHAVRMARAKTLQPELDAEREARIFAEIKMIEARRYHYKELVDKLQAELERNREIVCERGATIERLADEKSILQDELEQARSDRDKMQLHLNTVLGQFDERVEAELAPARQKIKELQELLRGLYGTVRGTAKWERRWPNISSMVKDAIG